MASFINSIFVPLILIIVVVAPLWIIFHYLFGKQSGRRLSKEENEQLESLAQTAEAMAARIAALESILDAETPNWRDKQ